MSRGSAYRFAGREGVVSRGEERKEQMLVHASARETIKILAGED